MDSLPLSSSAAPITALGTYEEELKYLASGRELQGQLWLGQKCWQEVQVGANAKPPANWLNTAQHTLVIP